MSSSIANSEISTMTLNSMEFSTVKMDISTSSMSQMEIVSFLAMVEWEHSTFLTLKYQFGLTNLQSLFSQTSVPVSSLFSSIVTSLISMIMTTTSTKLMFLSWTQLTTSVFFSAVILRIVINFSNTVILFLQVLMLLFLLE